MSVNIDDKYIRLFWSLFLSILFIVSSSNIVLNFYSESLSPTGVEKLSTKKEVSIYAYISGAVLYPGVYEIGNTTRLIDLIQNAGGFDSEADVNFINSSLNLSKRVFNEDHILVPFKKIDNSEAGEGQAEAEVLDSKISLNDGSKAELDTLPGVGESTINKIIENRPYSKPEDLLKVEGIGEKKFNEIKELIRL